MKWLLILSLLMCLTACQSETFDRVDANVLSVIGLLLDIVGVIVLFWIAPEKYPDPQSRAFFAIEDDSRDRW